MKTLTQVVLPIVALAGVVFGITYITSFSSRPPGPAVVDNKSLVRPAALRFNTILGRKDPLAGPDQLQLKYWRNSYEVGEKGHFDFWFSNSNEQPVRVLFTNPNCQCAGAELGIVPHEAYDRYVRHTVHAGLSGQIPALISQAVNTAELASAIRWKNLPKEGSDMYGEVPAGSAAQPQRGMIRLKWEGREPLGEKSISAKIVSQIEGAPSNQTELKAQFFLSPPFLLHAKNLTARNSLQVGNLEPGSVAEQELFIASKTRPFLKLDLEPLGTGSAPDFVRCSAPVRLSDEQVALYQQQFPQSGEVRCIYRATVTVRERTVAGAGNGKAARQLDLGPLDLGVRVICRARNDWEEDKATNLMLTGTVRGDVHILGGDAQERIDFGPSFSSSESRTTQVSVICDRADLELAIDTEATTPDFLEVSLKRSPTAEQNAWSLRVTIPGGKLYGDLRDAYVVLRTKETPARRVRIPIRAITYDGSR